MKRKANNSRGVIRGSTGVGVHVRKMERAYRGGATLQEIGDEYGVCRERIRQILNWTPVTSKNGGISKRASDKKERKRIDRIFREEKQCMKYWGCTALEKAVIKLAMGGSLDPYKSQRGAATYRGIPWEFSLKTWWGVWVKSGKWAIRGKRIGEYVMARKRDTGPYCSDNVYIITCSANIKERGTFA